MIRALRIGKGELAMNTEFLEVLRSVLAWSTVINFGVLLWWFVFIAFAHDWVYRIHGKWFKMPVERFDAIHYAGIAFYKISILVFNLVPYLALRIVL
jgi:hypothetical protein